MSELEDILNHLETTSLEPKDQKILWKYIKDLQQENQKIKSTLNLYKGSLHREHEAIHRANDLEEENQELKNQQKEFIQWLKNQIQKQETYGGYFSKFFQDVLSKYKEIIGGK